MVSVRDRFQGYMTTLHQEPQHKTLAKKLIINVAPTGSYTNRQQNPHQPYTMTENVQAAIEAYKAGAAIWHVHARDDDGMTCKDPHVVKETISRVLDKCPDFITSVVPFANYDHHGIQKIAPMVELLTRAGPEYMQTAVLLVQTMARSENSVAVISEDIQIETVRFLEQHGVKPEFQGHSYSGLKDMFDWIIARDLASKPYLFNVMAGFHGYSYASPMGSDPWNYIYLMTMQQILPANSVTGICAGGRNWIAFATMAILLGFDAIRIGMEDSVYTYPHSNDHIRSSADMVRRVVAIAEQLGREVATPAEARAIMGLGVRELPTHTKA